MTEISIADFSRFPVGRYPTDGPKNGETFRDTLLMPALKRGEVVTVLLDGVAGYPSSFLEEAFAGLVKKHSFTPQELRDHLVLKANARSFAVYIDEIWAYIDDAAGGTETKNVRSDRGRRRSNAMVADEGTSLSAS